MALESDYATIAQNLLNGHDADQEVAKAQVYALLAVAEQLANVADAIREHGQEQ